MPIWRPLIAWFRGFHSAVCWGQPGEAVAGGRRPDDGRGGDEDGRKVGLVERCEARGDLAPERPSVSTSSWAHGTHGQDARPGGNRVALLGPELRVHPRRGDPKLSR